MNVKFLLKNVNLAAFRKEKEKKFGLEIPKLFLSARTLKELMFTILGYGKRTGANQTNSRSTSVIYRLLAKPLADFSSTSALKSLLSFQDVNALVKYQ